MTRRPLKQSVPWADADDDALRELVDQGLSVFAIAKQLRRHQTTITRRMELLNIGPKEREMPQL